MPWPHTPHRSAPHLPPHRTQAPTWIAVVVSAIAVVLLIALVRWYVG